MKNKMTKSELVQYIQEQVKNLYTIEVLKEEYRRVENELNLIEEGKKKSEYSKAAKEFISSKMKKMAGEKKPHDQKIAIAMSMAREKGLKVPSEKNESEKPSAGLTKKRKVKQ
ncbi:MAG: hypothetical protein KatS3mg035_1132 [Bacteroidia bacterium]|nr:MAG: hypothetical protein KatS3mg035_1132 [Bacteroidia bacterium]